MEKLQKTIVERQKIIAQNDSLCLTERFIRDKMKSHREKAKRDRDSLVASRSLPNLGENNDLYNISSLYLYILLLIFVPADRLADPPVDIRKEENNNNDRDISVDKDIRFAISLAAERPDDAYILQRAMSMQQYGMLKSLSTVPKLRASKTEQGKKGNKGRGLSLKEADIHEQQKVIYKGKSDGKLKTTFSLSAKLEALEELLDNCIASGSKSSNDSM